MRVLLLQLDGRMPNLALMRVAAHHRQRGDEVEFRHAPSVASVERGLFDDHERIYASLIFERTRPVARRLVEVFPGAVVGGTGWDLTETLERVGITTQEQDYTIYPRWQSSIGFSQRGCRLSCGFCVVPRKEGKVHGARSVYEIWRGEPWPRELVLLDNDFFGSPQWRERIAEIRQGGFKVCFSQGINARMLSQEAAAALASVDYRSWRMTYKQLYTAWDSAGDEAVLFRGLQLLVDAGIKPKHLMVYMLIGYWPGETHADRDYRRARLREFGADPYPMPFVRTRELVGFQRWVIGAYDKRVPWSRWESAGYEPRKLGDG